MQRTHRSTSIQSWIFTILVSVFSCLNSISAQASATEEIFQEVFITAGYATAFGAALGAASLSLYDEPQRHLQSIAIGASLGFIGGSILGSYMALSPMIVMENDSGYQNLAVNRKQRLQMSPLYSPQTGQVHGIVGAWQVADF